MTPEERVATALGHLEAAGNVFGHACRLTAEAMLDFMDAFNACEPDLAACRDRAWSEFVESERRKR